MRSWSSLFWACLASALLSACGTAGLRSPEADEVAATKDKRIVAMVPFIRSFELGVGQQKFRRVDSEHRIRADIVKAFDIVAKDTGWFKTVPFPALSDELMVDFEQRAALFQSGADTYILMQEKGGNAWDALSKNFRASVGQSPAFAEVYKQTGTRYGVLLAAVEINTTALAKGVGIVSHLVTFGQVGLQVSGTLHTLMGVLDFKTGDIVWLRYEKDAGSLDDQEAISKVIKVFLDGSPLSGAKS